MLRELLVSKTGSFPCVTFAYTGKYNTLTIKVYFGGINGGKDFTIEDETFTNYCAKFRWHYRFGLSGHGVSDCRDDAASLCVDHRSQL